VAKSTPLIAQVADAESSGADAPDRTGGRRGE